MPHTSGNATRFLTVVAALAAVRVALPLAALAASGSKLPGLPHYDYVPTTGDGSGYYAATREFLASWGRLPLAILIALVLGTLVGAAALIWGWRRRSPPREWLLVLGAAGFALIVAIGITQMNPPGAAVFGWPLVWSLPMLPYRALGFPLDPDIAFGFGVTLSLFANAVTVVATAFVGLYATGRRSLGLAAASLFAFWPLLVGIVGGSRAWENGTWTVDAGLAMYTEPLSTALVTLALASLLSPRLTAWRTALAGVGLGLATTAKLSNAIVAAAALALLAIRFDRGRVLPYLAGLVSFAPIVIAYWPKSYYLHESSSWPQDPFAVDYVIRSWSESLLFGPRTLVLIVPLAVLGVVVLRGWWARLLLVAWVVGNAAFYSLYRLTYEHPRFLFASLPPVFVLWTVGAASLLQVARRPRSGRAGRPRLLVLNQYYRPGVEATGQLLAQLCDGLAADYDVTVVTGRLPTPEGASGRATENGVSVVRVRSTAFPRHRLVLRALNYLSYLTASFWAALRAARPDVVICMTDPPVIANVALVVARRHRAPLLVISQDVFPEIAVLLGRIENRLVVGLLRRAIRHYLGRADRVVAIGETMRRRLELKGTPRERLRVIPNWVDAETLTERPRDNAWAKEFALSDAFVVMHSGNVGFAQDLDTLVRSATFLRDLDRLVIAIVGGGARQGELIALAELLEVDQVRFIPYQRRELLPLSLSAAHVHVVGLAAGLAGYVVPSRLYGVLAVSRPVVVAADADSETAQIVSQVGCGVVVPPGRPELLAAEIRRAYDGEYDFEDMARRGREYVALEADRVVAIRRYREVLRELDPKPYGKVDP